MSYDTVKNYLSAVKRFHELSGIQFPINIHLLKLEMMSIRKELATAVKKATPMTPTLLREIYSKVDLTSAVEVTCYAALVIGFHLFL